MKKRIVCGLLTISMMLSLFVGCGKKEAEVSGDGATLTIGVPQNANVTSYDDNALTKYLEESLDINLKFVNFSSSSKNYLQQLTLMASSGETMPDVLWGFTGMDNETRNEFGEAGYFIDLTDLIDKYGTNYKEQLAKLDKDEQKRITNNGESNKGAFYGMPQYSEQLIDNLGNMLYINQSWLDAVGMKAPTNIDELYSVLKAFKEQDPNGNGKADEIPIFGTTGLSMNICDYIINAYVYYDNERDLNVDSNGKLWAPYTTDEYRDAVIFMNKLREEGLLSELSFSVSSTTEQIALHTPSNGTSLVGIWQGHPSISADKSSPVVAEYTALGSLGDATGKGGYKVVKESQITFGSFITKDCKNPELAMKFLDFFYDEETLARARHGEKGVDWEEGTGKTIYGTDSKIKVINSGVFFKGNKTWCSNGNSILTHENYIAIDEAVNDMDKEINRLMRELYEDMQAGKLPDKVAVGLKYTEEEYEVISETSNPLKSFIIEARNLFILGTQDPSNDAQWQEYLNNLEKLGLSKYIKVKQASYDRQQAEQ